MEEQVTVRWEPWGGDAGIERAGRAHLVTPASVDRACVHETGVELLPLGTIDGDRAIWEIPAIGAAERAIDGTTVIVLSSGLARSHVRVPVPAGIARATVDDSGDPGDVAPAPPETVATEQLIAQHVDRLHRSAEDHRAGSLISGVVDGSRLCADYWADTDDETDDPRLELIVRIAQECPKLIEDLCQRPRKVLRRRREQMNLAHVQQIDDACLRWIVRQPGTRIAEKAGPRQRVLAVARRDSVDTPENRVLRDFVALCSRAASLYDVTYRGFHETGRMQKVRGLASLTRRALRASSIADVPKLVAAPEPNYVLQFDERYGQVWRWYQRLRRQEVERQQIWAWQHRIWAERCFLAVLHALDDTSRRNGSFRSRIVIRNEAVYGQLIDDRSRLGPWTIGPGSVFLRHRPNSDLRAGLRSRAPDFVLIGQSPFAEREHVRIGVWSIYDPTGADATIGRRVTRLASALADDDRFHGGLLLVPESVDSETSDRFVAHSATNRVLACRIPITGRASQEAFAAMCELLRRLHREAKR